MGADLATAEFSQTQAVGTDFTGSLLRGAEFLRSVLSGAIFWKCDVFECVFIDCKLDRADFSNAMELGTVEFAFQHLEPPITAEMRPIGVAAPLLLANWPFTG